MTNTDGHGTSAGEDKPGAECTALPAPRRNPASGNAYAMTLADLTAVLADVVSAGERDSSSTG